jgi:hypothetical protein
MGLIVAFSGGKDSTALALRLAEIGKHFRLLYTPTGNELPGVREHIDSVTQAIGAELIEPEAPTLGELIEEQRCLPNWKMRWCTRMIKIEPCADWLRQHPSVVLAVGLRADEEGRVGGTYEGAETIYPLREWGWNEPRVIKYVEQRGFQPPPRTDCAVCYQQTLFEWWTLWSKYPSEYAQGEAWEREIGHTLRSAQRDTWPAGLADLRREFESGRKPKPRRRKQACRVCSL